jgi:putative phosphoribosyl transferase
VFPASELKNGRSLKVMICAARQAALWAMGEVTLASRELHAALTLPPHASGMVALCYAHPETRRAPVQETIVKSLARSGSATCVVELLDPEEAERPCKLKDTELLLQRMHATLDLLAARSDTRRLPLALLGADASVPAALAVAHVRAGQIKTVVGCCGRPDLAPIELTALAVPTLLVVPSKEDSLVRRNQQVFELLNCPSQLAVIVGASREFTEPGTLVACDYVVQQWCARNLQSAARSKVRS